MFEIYQGVFTNEIVGTYVFVGEYCSLRLALECFDSNKKNLGFFVPSSDNDFLVTILIFNNDFDKVLIKESIKYDYY